MAYLTTTGALPSTPYGAPGTGRLPALDILCADIERITIVPRLFALDTGRVYATAPMLRGVWGAALHDLDPQAYVTVFCGRGPAHDRTPLYVVRPSRLMEYAPALEWISIGAGAFGHDRNLMRAWDIASGKGLGPRREPFRIRHILALGPNGSSLEEVADPRPWTLNRAGWPIPGDPAITPCRLRFTTPLRLIRDKRLIEQPSFADIVLAAMRRIGCFSPRDDAADAYRALRHAFLDLARNTAAMPWVGNRCDLVRYSGRQKQELDFHGVAGYLELPEGPGPVWPALAAAQWLHIGKGAVVGMGQLSVEPLTYRSSDS